MSSRTVKVRRAFRSALQPERSVSTPSDLCDGFMSERSLVWRSGATTRRAFGASDSSTCAPQPPRPNATLGRGPAVPLVALSAPVARLDILIHVGCTQIGEEGQTGPAHVPRAMHPGAGCRSGRCECRTCSSTGFRRFSCRTACHVRQRARLCGWRTELTDGQQSGAGRPAFSCARTYVSPRLVAWYHAWPSAPLSWWVRRCTA